MKKARLRALTHLKFQIVKCSNHGRNEESPTEGIDTFMLQGDHQIFCKVEMKKARLRALTQCDLVIYRREKPSRNELMFIER